MYRNRTTQEIEMTHAHAFGPPRRRPRGDVRAAMLLVLAEESMSGYGLMQEIENRSEGVWRPSPGSVYPALAQLEDEGRPLDAPRRSLYRILAGEEPE